jgi:hypothetical protein
MRTLISFVVGAEENETVTTLVEVLTISAKTVSLLLVSYN